MDSMTKQHSGDTRFLVAMRDLREHIATFEREAQERGQFVSAQMQHAMTALRDELKREHDHIVRRWD